MIASPKHRPCRQSGAAVVEFALLLLVLVPILFAALFVGDAVRFRLDVQGAVILAAWDHAVARWDHDADGQSPADVKPTFDAHARTLLCDHSIAQQRPGNASRDCGDVPAYSRRTLASQLLWSDEGGERWEDRGVRCSIDRSASSPQGPPGARSFHPEPRLGRIHERWTFGGKITCEATAWLYNHLIPGLFFSGRTTQPASSRGGGAGTLRSAGAPLLSLADRFAILADTWASDDPRDRPLERGCRAPGNADHGVLRRVEDLWSGGSVLARDREFGRFVAAHNDYAKANEFVAVRRGTGCIEGGTLSGIAGAVLGSDPSALVVSLRHPLRDPSRPGPGAETLLRPSGLLAGSPEDRFLTVPWDVEGIADPGYSRTFTNRGSYYLGCSRSGGCSR